MFVYAIFWRNYSSEVDSSNIGVQRLRTNTHETMETKFTYTL